MNELINEVRSNIEICEHTIARRKKHYEYPFTRDCDHYYSLIILQNTLDTWKICLDVISKYKKFRAEPIEPFLSEQFKERMEIEIKHFPGTITEKTRYQMIDYMKRLEWMIEDLEDKVISANQEAK